VDKDPELSKSANAASTESQDLPKAEDRDRADASAVHPEHPHSNDLDDFYKKLQPEMRRPKPSPDAIAAALDMVQRLAAQADAENAGGIVAQQITTESVAGLCAVCGYQNRGSNKFCGMCGQPVEAEVPGDAKKDVSRQPEEERTLPVERPRPRQLADMDFSAGAPPTPETQQGNHHYHHHYHHHYFPAGEEGVAPRVSANPAREAEKILRPSPVLRGEAMSRTEATVRRVTQDWVLACNTKHLDDLLELYIADAMVMRSNYPAVRGAAALREFFFAALDAGFGDVEVEPLRVEIIGDIAYEAGRFKALVPGAGKRREERGKYLWVLNRLSTGEWKLAADCWSSDLTLAGAEAEVKAVAPKAVPLRKNS